MEAIAWSALFLLARDRRPVRQYSRRPREKAPRSVHSTRFERMQLEVVPQFGTADWRKSQLPYLSGLQIRKSASLSPYRSDEPAPLTGRGPARHYEQRSRATGLRPEFTHKLYASAPGSTGDGPIKAASHRTSLTGLARFCSPPHRTQVRCVMPPHATI